MKVLIGDSTYTPETIPDCQILIAHIYGMETVQLRKTTATVETTTHIITREQTATVVERKVCEFHIEGRTAPDRPFLALLPTCGKDDLDCWQNAALIALRKAGKNGYEIALLDLREKVDGDWAIPLSIERLTEGHKKQEARYDEEQEEMARLRREIDTLKNGGEEEGSDVEHRHIPNWLGGR